MSDHHYQFEHPHYTFVQPFEDGRLVVQFETDDPFTFGTRYQRAGRVAVGAPTDVELLVASSARTLIYTADDATTLQVTLALANALAEHLTIPVDLYLQEGEGRTFLVASTNEMHCDVERLDADLLRLLDFASNVTLLSELPEEVEVDPLDMVTLDDARIIEDDGVVVKDTFKSALSSSKAEVVPGEMVP